MPLDLERYRAEFPVTESSIYLNHAAVAPISRRVRDAMVEHLADVQTRGSENYSRWVETYHRSRCSAARLINSQPEEIAFVKNTSEGISLFAHGLEWRPGDEVVSVEGEFPANFYPWKLLEKQGVTLHLVKVREGTVDLNMLAAALSPRTRVVTVSFVQFLSGYRLDLSRLGRICADHGALLFVDAIQGLGAFPLDVQSANVAGLAADGHKFLLGPEGCGVLYVRRDLQEQLRPTTIGWTNFRHGSDFLQRDFTWQPDARRYEPGSLNTVGIYGLQAAIDLILEIGVGPISQRVLDLTDRLRRGLRERGYEIYGPATREESSGIVSCMPRRESAESLWSYLRSRKVIVSSRSGKVRFSPHFYITENEIDQVLALL